MTNEQDIREAALIVSDILKELEALTKPGVNVLMLDELAERRVRERGGEPYNKGYKPDWAVEPFPNTLCVSIDFQVCHGIPQNYDLQEGQIVNYDLGIRYKSACGDAALTVPVGVIDNRKVRLLRYAKRALHEGISAVKAGVSVAEVGHRIDQYLMQMGYTVIKEYGGHGIGKEMHEDPQIAHYRTDEGEKVILQEGMIICLEPIVTPGSGRIKVSEDGWTTYCLDGQPVAMFEHMILVTKDGSEILTKIL